jgi:hypothetical protein
VGVPLADGKFFFKLVLTERLQDRSGYTRHNADEVSPVFGSGGGNCLVGDVQAFAGLGSNVLSVTSKKPAAANLRPQASPASHGLFSSGCECRVHPITGATFFGPKKENALEFKLDSN